MNLEFRLRAIAMTLLLVITAVGVAAMTATSTFAQDSDEGIGETGTDPRDFAPKFMPYYRYTELENGLEQQEVVLFGMTSFSPKFAMTYEIPLAYHRDISNTALKNPNGTCGPGFIPGGGGLLPNGIDVSEGDCEEAGVGDMNLRFLYRTSVKFLGGDFLVGSQFNFPTANEDVLGSEQFQIAPLVAHVHDLTSYPAPGAFMAYMHFYFFDAFGDAGREDVSYYLGRYFFMLPIHPSGIYALPEVQLIYDWERDDDELSLWVGPEFGKLLAPGRILYAKPGWGVIKDADSDRDFSFEVGFRYFFD